MEQNSDNVPSSSSSVRKSAPSTRSSRSPSPGYPTFLTASKKSDPNVPRRAANYQFECTLQTENNHQSDKVIIESNAQSNTQNIYSAQPKSRDLRSFVRLDDCNQSVGLVSQKMNSENSTTIITTNSCLRNNFDNDARVNTTTAFPSNLQDLSFQISSRCSHPLCDALENAKAIEQIPTEYFEKQLQKYSNSDLLVGDSAKLSEQINGVFLNRLQDIDNNADGHRDLKLITYQEWVDILLKINQSIITNMEELESEVAERLQCLRQKVNTDCRRSQSDELLKCRQDINSLIRIVQNAYHNDTWDFQGLSFETISLSQILCDGETERNGQYMRNTDTVIETKKQLGLEQKHKLHCNIKALAVEVAEKHDEIQALKRQVVCMEDEMQNAQKKIQLKEEIIKELRSDLKCTNAKLVSRSCLQANFDMAPVNLENQTVARSDAAQGAECSALTLIGDCCTQLDTLSRSESIEQQKLKMLEDELNEYFKMNEECNKQKLETHRKHLLDIFQKSEIEKIEACRKLDFIRRKLMDLEASAAEANYDCDTGFSSNSENDKDFKIVESVRNRLRKLSETGFELKKRVQKLELENNELETSLTAEKEYSECNSRTLKQVADLLCSMINKQFSYTDIYNKECTINPFCDAIVQIKGQYQEQESQLFRALALKNKKIEELGKALLDREREYSDMRRSVMSESMRCQLEHMQHAIAEREQKILQLSAMLARVSHKHQGEPINAVEYRGPMQSMQPMQPTPPTTLSMPIPDNKTIHLEKRVKHLVSALDRSRKEENFLRLETRKLNEELNESKKKNEDLTTQTNRLASLLKTQENHRMELACKYESLDKSFEDQSKKLRAATGQVRLLNDRFQLLEKRQCELNMERNLLREEVMALKEKEAVLMGRQKAMEEQLIKAEKEMYTAHDVVKEQQSILQRSENNHREVVKRLQEANNEMRQKMCSLMQQYKNLEGEFEKQRGAFNNSEKLIESFRKWKDDQQKTEERTRDTFKQYEDHIRLLLQEKQRFVEQYRELHRDYSAIQSELDRIRICSISMSGYNLSQTLSEKSIEQIDVIRRTTRRLEEQSSSLKGEVVSKIGSFSSFKQIEETYD
ncbi:restin homolog isoform X1 [Glossina fuscipes]|uniref:Restin homolog isoform X1 n=1 Tax=Glossina fuscipes TaxID=7396 RepID=A0A9C6DMU4_9MUSC|nr:restin homolog isoform X1 [Glossina fuscipes]XP_037894569.1 restin homolog isoform X1 [Glossina fuscipes]XP_037894570.1 restin homolog isoform X1 [Glossina fuscipes]XP_037894571.1 restin homolog isoform X1 [Glossina fuscipes]XP_037894572.1 restin homolog isoform X1 [Glossina fuscipes]